MHTASIVLQMWEPFTEWKMLLDSPEHRAPGLCHVGLQVSSLSANQKIVNQLIAHLATPSILHWALKKCCQNPSGIQGCDGAGGAVYSKESSISFHSPTTNANVLVSLLSLCSWALELALPSWRSVITSSSLLALDRTILKNKLENGRPGTQPKRLRFALDRWPLKLLPIVTFHDQHNPPLFTS